MGRVEAHSSGDSPLVSTHRLELTLWPILDWERCISTCTHKTLASPTRQSSGATMSQHCRNSARGFPRPQARVLQAGVPDVRQAKAPRPHPPDPRSARRPRPHLHHRIFLLPSPHRDLRNLQGKRKAILKYFMKKPNKTFLLLPPALKKKNEKIQAVLSNISLYINYTKSARIKWITNQF